MKYMPNGTCGVTSFGVKGGREVSNEVHGQSKAGSHCGTCGRRKDCVLHPASTTHRQLTDKQLVECGITPDMIRMS